MGCRRGWNVTRCDDWINRDKGLIVASNGGDGTSQKGEWQWL